MTTHIPRPVAALCAAAMLASACADAPLDQARDTGDPDVVGATELQEPLHKFTIALSPDHALTYRAYADGALIIGEKAPLEQDAVLTKSAPSASLGPLALFQAVHPGAPVSEALSALQAFLDRAVPEGEREDLAHSLGSGASSADGTAPRATDKGMTSDPRSFLDAFGCFFAGDDVFDACVPSWSGNAYAAATSRWAIYKLAPYRQDLRFDTSIAGEKRLSLPLSEGGFWVQLQAGPQRIHNGSQYPDVVAHRLDISSSGELHFSARFHNYLTSDANCAESWSGDKSSMFGRKGNSTSAPICTSHYGRLR